MKRLPVFSCRRLLPPLLRLLRLLGGGAALLAFVGALLAPLRAQEAWTGVLMRTTQNLWSVCAGPGQFIAVGEGGTVLASPDGLDWAPRASGRSLWLVSVAYGGGLYVIVGDQGTILTSPDGTAWTSRASGTTARLNGVAYGGGRWLAVAESGELITSTDTITWTKLSPSRDRLRGVTYAYGQFVITGDNGLMRSTVDTTDYSTTSLVDGYFIESVVYGRRRFVAVGESGYIVTSDDNAGWKRVPTASDAYLRGVTFFNGQFIAVGDGGTVLTSPTGTEGWTRRDTGSAALLTAVAAGESSVVAVGLGGAMLRSTPAPAAPIIVTAPANVSGGRGDNVAFGVTANGSLPLTYQWNFNGAPLTGETSDRLFLSSVQPPQGGAYSVTVRNSLGSVTTPAALLTVTASSVPGPLLDPTFNPAPLSGVITTVAEQSDGKLVVVLGGEDRGGGNRPLTFTRLSSDGTIDPTFKAVTGSIPSGQISQLIVQPDDRLLVVGQFTTIGGVSRRNLARLNVDGSVDESYTPPASVTSAIDLRIKLDAANRVLLVGDRRVLRLTPDGTLDPTFIGPPGTYQVFSVAPLVGGKLIATDGGRELRRLNPDGTFDSTYPPYATPFESFSPLWRELTPSPDGSVIAGRLTDYGPFGSSLALTRLDRDGIHDRAWLVGGVSGNNGPFLRFAVGPAGKLLVLTRGNPAAQPYYYGFNCFNADGTVDRAFMPGTGPDTGFDDVQVFALRDGRWLVTGRFLAYEGVQRRYLARLLAANAPPDRQAPTIVSVTPEAVAVRPGELVTLNVNATGSGPLTYRWSGYPALYLPLDLRYLPQFLPAYDTSRSTLQFVATGSGKVSLTVNVSNSLGSVTSVPISLTVAPSAPVVTVPPKSATVTVGRSLTFSVEVGGSGTFTYEWFRGATSLGPGVTLPYNPATLTLTNITAADAGDYTVVVRNNLGVTTSQVARLTVLETPQLVNISTRATAGLGDRAVIVGFVIRGPVSKQVLIRGLGPALGAFGVPGTLPDPELVLRDSAGRLVSINDNGAGSAGQELGAFRFESGFDSVITTSLPAGSYTATVVDTFDRTGTALVEIYEADSNSSRIVNLSTRAFVGTDASVGIAGIVVRGPKPGRYLIRGVGPALAPFGVTGALADPVLVIKNESGITVASNDDWSSNANAAEIATAATAVGAFPLGAGSRDSALLVTLPPGAYSVLVNGAGGTTGIALIETYEVP